MAGTRFHRVLMVAVLLAAMGVAAEAVAASEGGCRVKAYIKRGDDVIAEWENSDGPTAVYLTPGIEYKFLGSCSCTDNVTLSSNIGDPPKGAGPGGLPWFTHTFALTSGGIYWIEATCTRSLQKSRGSFYVVLMDLERVGAPSIEAANTYSENQTIRVTAKLDMTTPLTSFSGTVNIAEHNTTIYEENGGTLPASVTIPDDQTGSTTFVAKSIAGPKTRFVAGPDHASVHATNYASWVVGVEQWVDTNDNDRVDWLEEWSDDILASYQDLTHEIGGVTGKVTAIGVDLYENGTCGETTMGEETFRLNPAAPDTRTDRERQLHNTILHESRHVFQTYDCYRTGFPGMNDDEHDTHEDPDNDDDPIWQAIDGDWLPEVVFYDSEKGENSILDGDTENANGSHGDDTHDDWLTIAKLALEKDAVEFADKYEHVD